MKFKIFGYRIKIQKIGISGNERIKNLYRRRRYAGKCVQCSRLVESLNPRTGNLYRKCDSHRLEDNKYSLNRFYAKKLSQEDNNEV